MSEIKKRFSQELNQIGDKLQQLEEGRVYELTQVRADGSLQHNTQELRTMISELLAKIDTNAPSFEEDLNQYFK